MPSSEYTVCHDFTIFSEDFPGPDEGFSAIIPRLFAAMRSRIFRFSPKKRGHLRIGAALLQRHFEPST